ncbi:MAG: hypothetical protein AB7R90_11480 [Reyranellaceae bacterium]
MAKPKPPLSEADRRQQRLAAALRDNLKRRKAQVRARAETASEAGDSPVEPDSSPAKT